MALKVLESRQLGAVATLYVVSVALNLFFSYLSVVPVFILFSLCHVLAIWY